MDVSEFLRLNAVRAPSLMWFLGAGASASAGVPTAYHLIWEFKRIVFCSEQRVPVKAVADLADPAVRLRLQQYFESKHSYPEHDSDDEYAFYFEAAYPSEADRRRVLDSAMSGATPSYGHKVMAALMSADRVRIVWTTNFDPMVEDAAADVFRTTGRLTTATPDAPELARQALAEERWPLLVKLHGDFRSRRLRNTSDELRRQDADLRDSLIRACQRYGVIVVGYSGRDQSVMETLELAIDGGRGYPAGLFWFHRREEDIRPSVQRLVDRATSAGIEATFIDLETFDELMGDLLNLEHVIPEEVRKPLDQSRKRWVSDAPLPGTSGNFPVLRMNAFPVLEWPSTCRLVVCEIGGTAEVLQAVQDAQADLIVARRASGIICFGADAEVRKAFSNYGISKLDLHPIDAQRLRYSDSAELGLLYNGIVRAIVRELPLRSDRHAGRHRLLVDESVSEHPGLKALREAVGLLGGVVGANNLNWFEAVEIRLEYRLSRLWLMIVPTIAVPREQDTPLSTEAVEFVREHLARRYNRKANQLLDAWKALLLGDAQAVELRAFGVSDGVDAVFRLGGITAFSRRRKS